MNPSRLSSITAQRWFVPALLLLIIAIGAFFRIWDLGRAAFRADEGLFWDIFRYGLTPGEVYDKWLNTLGQQGQLPFAAAFTKWFVDFFRLPVNHFTVHLPTALWGVASIVAAYGAGRALAGNLFGLVLALLLALNPYHIQFSREAYYYGPLVCGSFLGLWALFWAVDHLRTAKPLTPSFLVLNAASFYLLAYSQPSGWPLCLMIGLTILVCAGWRSIKERKLSRPLLIVLGTYLVLGIPLLVVPWGTKTLLSFTSGAQKKHNLAIFALSGPASPKAIWNAIAEYGWGNTPARGLFTAIAIGFAVVGVWRNGRKDFRYALLAVFLVLGFAFGMLSRMSTGWPFASRYFMVLLPLFLTLLAVGMWNSDALFAVRMPAFARRLPVVLTIVACVLWVWPAFLCTQLDGKPTPYKKINAWVDSNLPRGTLVLVDRWFEPWCEFKVEPSTNVIYTYTIPNEPLDNYINYRWRDTAISFLTNNPDSAYLEIAKTYWESPKVGDWKWPREYFSRRVVIANEACLKLRDLGLGAREEYYAANTNRTMVELFYNTRDDVLKKAQADGLQFVAFYGNDWSYWKNGPGWNQTQSPDFRDWRVLQGKASIELYNVSEKSRAARLIVSAVAVQAPKDVEFGNGQKHRFEANHLEQFEIDLVLPPGHFSLTWTDNAWTRAKVPLLVQQMVVVPASLSSAKGPDSSQ